MTNERKCIKKILKTFMLETYEDDIECSTDKLYKLSSSLNVSTMVGYVLNKKKIKDTYFEKTLYKSIIKYERLLKTKKEIDTLFKHKINYLYIKGITLAKYYKEPFLRYSNDIDVVVKDNIDLASNLLKKAGYRLIVNNVQELCFIKKGILIDLHRTFSVENDNLERIFNQVDYTDHEFDINYKYLYLLVHAMKHIKFGQFEFRFFVDLFYLRQLIDRDLVNTLLKESNLILFDDKVNYYLDALLNKKEYDDLCKKIEEFIFQYGEDSGSKNRVLINSVNKSKFSYLLSRIFIPYNKMCYEYPILDRHKFLLPIYYIVRMFKPLKSKRVKYTYQEVTNSLKKSKIDVNVMKEFIDSMGIY